MLHLLLMITLQPAAAPPAQELWQAWPEERFVGSPAPCMRHEELTHSLQDLAARHPGRLRLAEAGRSYLGRPVHLLTLGRGERKILLWSQMHGDEPSATPALLDLADFLLGDAGGDAAREILDAFTLLHGPDAQPRRRRGLRTAQRAGHRHQP